MKRTSLRTAAAVAAVALALIPLPAYAGKGIEIGAKMPDFQLKDTDGNVHKLSDYKGKVVVLDFCSKNCPWSRGSDPNISELAKAYEDEGVVFLGIDADRDNSPNEIAAYAGEVGVPFPILKDVDNEYADVVAASRTPEIYIVNEEGTLVYHGAFDNRTTPTNAGNTNYVAKALDEVMAGQDVTTPTVSAWGCTIRRVAKKAGSDSK